MAIQEHFLMAKEGTVAKCTAFTMPVSPQSGSEYFATGKPWSYVGHDRFNSIYFLDQNVNTQKRGARKVSFDGRLLWSKADSLKYLFADQRGPFGFAGGFRFMDGRGNFYEYEAGHPTPDPNWINGVRKISNMTGDYVHTLLINDVRDTLHEDWIHADDPNTQLRFFPPTGQEGFFDPIYDRVVPLFDGFAMYLTLNYDAIDTEFPDYPYYRGFREYLYCRRYNQIADPENPSREVEYEDNFFLVHQEMRRYTARNTFTQDDYHLVPSTYRRPVPYRSQTSRPGAGRSNIYFLNLRGSPGGRIVGSDGEVLGSLPDDLIPWLFNTPTVNETNTGVNEFWPWSCDGMFLGTKGGENGIFGEYGQPVASGVSLSAAEKTHLVDPLDNSARVWHLTFSDPGGGPDKHIRVLGYMDGAQTKWMLRDFDTGHLIIDNITLSDPGTIAARPRWGPSTRYTINEHIGLGALLPSFDDVPGKYGAGIYDLLTGSTLYILRGNPGTRFPNSVCAARPQRFASWDEQDHLDE